MTNADPLDLASTPIDDMIAGVVREWRGTKWHVTMRRAPDMDIWWVNAQQCKPDGTPDYDQIGIRG